ncbi:putative transposase [Halorhodospira halochloris]|uniref:Transposase n=1 Tax=Halorhodospira halochloris TaxID=1052 RepID=A0A110B6W1_HALHR|nr:putative transposase [Halorhodospira halochloris]
MYIARVYSYIQEKDVRQALEQTRPDRAEELVMTVAEEWIKRGEKRGEKRGQKRGSHQTATKTLLRQIERKFGAEAKEASRARVERAALGELEMWLDRILDAERIEDVFAED